MRLQRGKAGSIPVIRPEAVAQMVRALDCGSRGCGFEFHRSPQGPVAPTVELLLCKQDVTSSNLVRSTELNKEVKKMYNKFIRSILCFLRIHGPRSPLYKTDRGVYNQCRWCDKPILVYKFDQPKKYL